MTARLLAGLAAAALLPALLALLPVLHLAPNRLVTGAPVMASDALGAWLWPVVALAALGPALLVAGRKRASATLAGLACLTALALLLLGLGTGAAELIADKPPATRARLASGAWIGLIILAGVSALAAGRARLPGAGFTAAAALAAVVAGLWRIGSLDALSLAVELRIRSDSLDAALRAHLALTFGALGLAACITGGLAL